MSSELKEKITEQFIKNPKLRVLLFFDPEKESQEEVQNLDLVDIIIIQVENSHFSLKYRLETELFDKKIFLYFPHEKPTGKALRSFVLFDILKANKELQLDDVGEFMELFQLLPQQRSLASRYIHELKYKKNQRVVAKILNPESFEKKKLIHGLICCYLDFNTIVEPTICLAKLFTLALPRNQERFGQFMNKLKDDEVISTLDNWFSQYLEIRIEKFSLDAVLSALRRLKYNFLLKNVDLPAEKDNYRKLKIKEPQISRRLNTLMIDWEKDSNLNKTIQTVLDEIGGDIREDLILDIYGVDIDYGCYTQKMKYIILRNALEHAECNLEKTLNLIKKIDSDQNNEDIVRLIEFIKYSANYYYHLNNISSYILDKPENYIEKYANAFSEVDYYYRKLVSVYNKLDKFNLQEFLNLIDAISKIHNEYEKFLKTLNTEWLKCMTQFKFSFNELSVAKQYDFYKDFVQKSGKKVAVVVSDALRFEAAKELLSVLLSDPKGTAKIEYVLSSIPSNTRFGMASILPHKVLDYENGNLSIEEVSTEGILNREKILKMAESESVAIQYKKLITLDKEEAREIFKNKVVYIFHNTIDSVGDDRKSEHKTFEAVEQAIVELSFLIKRIHSSWNVAQVIVTSDHGFLFNYKELPESMYQNPPQSESILGHNRFHILEDPKAAEDSYVIPLANCSNVKSELSVLIPKAINRYRRQGAGVHFVHGGASLQEIIVPVIVSTRKREDIARKVSFKILNKDLKIVSGALKIRVFQEDAISNTIKSRMVIAGIYNNSNELISNETDLILDSLSDLPSERTKEFILNLSSKSAQETILFLKIFDKLDDKDRLNPLVNAKVINKTFIESDF